jgi:hypothetical protein
MAKVSLKSPCVVASVRERVTTGVSKHVRVGFEAKFCLDARPLHHAGEASRRERCAPLRGEHEGRLRLLLALQPPQRPQLVTEDRMGTRASPA